MTKNLASLLAVVCLTGCAYKPPLIQPLPKQEESSILAQHRLLWSGGITPHSDDDSLPYWYREDFAAVKPYIDQLQEGEYILPDFLFYQCTRDLHDLVSGGHEVQGVYRRLPKKDTVAFSRSFFPSGSAAYFTLGYSSEAISLLFNICATQEDTIILNSETWMRFGGNARSRIFQRNLMHERAHERISKLSDEKIQLLVGGHDKILTAGKAEYCGLTDIMQTQKWHEFFPYLIGGDLCLTDNDFRAVAPQAFDVYEQVREQVQASFR